ncbi:hypothetical protein GGR52DRAFT_550597 [Hypoxylon sp. FL1284]|nr:hypothetical protein GGR52DRAFT_550597 [Hypoxylon sp. FL1284]
MPPRLSLRPAGRHIPLRIRAPAVDRNSVCFFCSLSPSNATGRRPRRKPQNPRRFASTSPTAATARPALDPRKELEEVLLELQKHAANYVNLSRLQLALNGLRQKPGTESIRVAVLGLTNGSESSTTAKQVLKLLLADPLKPEEEWERDVDGSDITRPMIVRVGADTAQEPGSISLATQGSLLQEIHVSSATLNGHNLELLLTELNPLASAQEMGALEGFQDSVLVPAVDIPTSSTGRHTPITTPVHKALIVADGILGAASVISAPPLESKSVVTAAVNLPEYKPADTSPLLPFTPLDLGTASIGLGLVRKDLKNAIEFEHLWFQSRMPKLVDWLKADIMASHEGITKQPVRELIASLLRNTSGALDSEKFRRLGSSIPSTSAPTPVGALQSNLDNWAEGAHTELQEQLDLAFSSRRWRKLGWWKLFWRVDDVGMLTNDIISQRFLQASERSAIFLAGRMKEAGVALGPFPAVPLPADENGVVVKQPSASGDAGPSPPETLPWPTNIPATRRYLQTETIPALQALAQRLTVQTLGTSGLTTALAALLYTSTPTATLYEAGAVAALGAIWSLGRMQKQWEAARRFWEGEVREEGRKAVRAVEGDVADALEKKPGSGPREKGESREELDRARELVERAQELLGRLK